MDVNILELLGLAELFEDGDAILGVADILDNVTLPPMVNAWAAAPAPPPSPEAVRRVQLRRWLALAANIVIYTLCAVIIAVSLTIYFSKDNNSIFGYHIYHVESGSMTPQADSPKGGFRENDAIIVRNTAPENVKQGDIITFWQDDDRVDDPITHRVTQVMNRGGGDVSFATKGDANGSEDPKPVPGYRLIGVKILTLPRLGGALKHAQAHPWVTVVCCVGVMGAAFAVYLLWTKRAGKRKSW